MKRSLIFVVLMIMLSGGVKLNSGQSYRVIDATASKVEMAFNGVSLKFSNEQELKENTQIEHEEKLNIAHDLEQAAQIGGNILNQYYSDWTETHAIVVAENKYANAWVVSGQLISRTSAGNIGAVVFSKDTGEVFYIGKGIPVG